jgi:hypothetical protein
MENILNFLKDNWEFILVLVPLLLSLFANVTGGLKKIIVETMLFAEKKASEALAKQGLITGEEKKAFVIEYVYNKIPVAIRTFISKEYLAAKLENIIRDVQDIKDDGTLNSSFKE